jgi:pyruvate kinase
LGIVAKIETSDSIHNLARILIAGLELPKFAILIATGDLAVEVGFENLAFIQEDILCLCEAAHIPVILATQILESLAESGLRSRPEIMDAIMGQRAECVMLNNGKHILDLGHRLLTLLQMAAAAFMAVCVPDGLGKNSTGFALSYGAIRAILVIE